MLNTDELDQDLIKKIQKGDAQAFNILVIKYQLRIYKLVSRYATDSAENLDITQEAFIRAFKAISRFRGDCGFYTWLYRIAINTAKNYIKLKTRKVPSLDIEITEVEQNPNNRIYQRDNEAPEQGLINAEIHNIIYEILDELPKELKTAIILREIEGLTYNEISNIMNCPIGTVRSRIYRAKEVVEKRIEPLYPR